MRTQKEEWSKSVQESEIFVLNYLMAQPNQPAVAHFLRPLMIRRPTHRICEMLGHKKYTLSKVKTPI